MQPKTIGNYGGPYADATAADNPETDLAADEGNRVFEDTAQMTQTALRAEVTFETDDGAGVPFTITPTHNSLWGSGSGQAPTITKTADPGRYTVTYAASFNDGLSVSESVAFLRPMCQAWGSDPADDLYARVLTVASNVVTLVTQSPRGTDADVGDNSAAPFTVELWLR